MKKTTSFNLLTLLIIVLILLNGNAFAQCRASKPQHVTNTATNPNGAAFTGTILIGTAESDAGEFPLEIINIAAQDQNVFNPLWNPQKYFGPAGNQWTAAALGNLFGLTLDSTGNIYASSAGSIFTNGTSTGSLSGNHSGAIYKIDRTTGLASSFANLTQDDVNLPNDSVTLGPGIGNIASNYANPLYIYATNFEDGRIYRLNASGGIVDFYDHGTQGRPNALNVAGLEAIADTSATNGYYSQINNGITLPGRRTWAVEVRGNRVYYSVWWTTASGGLQPSWYQSPINIGDESTANEIWSVGLNADGSFNAASVRREFSMSAVSGQGAQEPVTDIVFTPNGRMLLATRGMALDGGINGNFHRGIVVELSGAYPAWTANSTKFRVGQNGSDSSGGLAYDPTGNAGAGRVWVTGEALFEGAFNNQQANTFGFQGMNDNGVNQINTTSVLVDADGVQQQEKGSIGDVDIACNQTTAAGASLGGRVVSASGNPLPRISVYLTDAQGNRRYAQSSPFGYFAFNGVTAGETYILEASGKGFRFENRAINVGDDVTDLSITALP